MQLFYAPDFTPPHYTLSEDESKHAVRVLRLTIDSTIHITDGRGNLFRCEVSSTNPKRCEVVVREHFAEYNPLPYSLTICVAPTKSADRYEWFLEKSTEIGVSEIVPLLTDHSERKVVKWERDMRVVTAAVKQSLKAYHPNLHQLTTFTELVKRPFDGDKFIAHCAPSDTKRPLPELLAKGGNVMILIGPEGDFSPEEVALARENGFRDISLGTQRLRSETAAVVATTMVAVKNM
ncbi:MAG: 16S rRNA (uracil(1498)-N(3))-methyltransferase [Rikenellaceae bacterium]